MTQTPSPKLKNPKIGIWIQFDGVTHVPGSTEEKPGAASTAWGEGNIYHMTLRVEHEGQARGKQSTSGRFITNPEIRAAISAGKVIPGTALGTFSLSRISRNTAEWLSYFPFDRIPKTSQRFFTRKGIAQLLELYALQHIQQQFPTITRVQHERDSWIPRNNISEARRAQIQSRGTDFSYSMQHVLDMLRWKIGRDTLKHRGKVIIATPRGKTAMQRVEARDPYTWKGKTRLYLKRVGVAIRKKLTPRKHN